MQTNIQIFTSDVFGEIRTCQVNNQIMFVGRDVALTLGYSNYRDALTRHVDKEDKDGVVIHDSIGRKQKAIFINESGLYALVLSSKLPQGNSARSRVSRLVKDGLVEKVDEFVENSTVKAKYKKTGVSQSPLFFAKRTSKRAPASTQMPGCRTPPKSKYLRLVMFVPLTKAVQWRSCHSSLASSVA